MSEASTITSRKKNIIPSAPADIIKDTPISSQKAESPSTNELTIDKSIDIRPPTARQGFVMGLQIASLESLFAIFVMLFGDVLITSLCQKVFQIPFTALDIDDDFLTIVCRLISFATTTFFIIYQFTTRHSITLKRFFKRAFFSKTVSLFAFGVIVLQAITTYVLYQIQNSYDLQIYSLTNYLGSDGNLSFYRAFELIIASPLREELVFRAIIVSYFYTHVGGQASKYKDRAAIGSAIFFGAVHLVNIFSGSLSPSYAWLQVCMGSLVGYLYGLRLFTSGLLETVIMHMANNIFASLLDPNISLDISNPIILASLLQSVITYTTLCYFSRMKLLSMKPSRYSLVDGIDSEPLPYSEDPDAQASISPATTKKAKSEKKIAKKKTSAKSAKATKNTNGEDTIVSETVNSQESSTETEVAVTSAQNDDADIDTLSNNADDID